MKTDFAWNLIKGTVNDFLRDKAFRLSAALAYYAVFSLGPLLVIVISVACLVFEKEAVQGQVQQQLQTYLGPKAAEAVEQMIAGQKKGTSIAATVIGIATLLFAATSLFGQLQDAMNTIWEVKPKPGRGIKGFIRDRFLSFAMVLGIAFLLLISMVIAALLEAATGSIGKKFVLTEPVAHALNLVVSFGVVTLLFAMIFKLLPDATVNWRDVWIGAATTAFLFTVGKYLLGFYLGREATTSAYGAAGSFVIVLLWVYYSSVILFLGAEFTQVYATARGSRIVPSKNAMPATASERANEGMSARKQNSGGDRT
jgi:membrane protein